MMISNFLIYRKLERVQRQLSHALKLRKRHVCKFERSFDGRIDLGFDLVLHFVFLVREI